MTNMRSATTTSLTILLPLIVIFIAVQPTEAGARRSKCAPERELEMDLCASRLGFLGDHSFRVPKNQTAAGAFCSQLKESLGCLQNYARDCLQGFTRQVLTSLMKRGKQQYSSVCSDARARQTLMDKMGCMADERIEPLHNTMDASVARFEYIQAKAHPDAKLQGVCCSYQIFNREMDTTLDKVCGKPKRPQGSTHEFVHKVVGGTAGEFFQLICDGHRSLEECRASKKTSELLGRLEEVTRQVSAGKLRPRNKSLVPVLLDILDASAQ